MRKWQWEKHFSQREQHVERYEQEQLGLFRELRNLIILKEYIPSSFRKGRKSCLHYQIFQRGQGSEGSQEDFKKVAMVNLSKVISEFLPVKIPEKKTGSTSKGVTRG